MPWLYNKQANKTPGELARDAEDVKIKMVETLRRLFHRLEGKK
jgi:hypothetical protein